MLSQLRKNVRITANTPGCCIRGIPRRHLCGDVDPLAPLDAARAIQGSIGAVQPTGGWRHPRRRRGPLSVLGAIDRSAGRTSRAARGASMSARPRALRGAASACGRLTHLGLQDKRRQMARGRHPGLPFEAPQRGPRFRFSGMAIFRKGRDRASDRDPVALGASHHHRRRGEAGQPGTLHTRHVSLPMSPSAPPGTDFAYCRHGLQRQSQIGGRVPLIARRGLRPSGEA